MPFSTLKALGGSIRKRLKGRKKEKPQTVTVKGRHPWELAEPSESTEAIHLNDGHMDSIVVAQGEPIQVNDGYLDTISVAQDEKTNDEPGRPSADGQGETNGSGTKDTPLPRAMSVPEIWKGGQTDVKNAGNPAGRTQEGRNTRVHSEGGRVKKVPGGLIMVSPSGRSLDRVLVQKVDGKGVSSTRPPANAQGSLRSITSIRKVTGSTLPGLPEEGVAAAQETTSVEDQALDEETQGTVRKYPNPKLSTTRASVLRASAGNNRAEEARRSSTSDRCVSQDSRKSHDQGRTIHVAATATRAPSVSKTKAGTITPAELVKATIIVNNRIAQTDGAAELEEDSPTSPRPRGGGLQATSSMEIAVFDKSDSRDPDAEADLIRRQSVATTRGSAAPVIAGQDARLLDSSESLSRIPTVDLLHIGAWQQTGTHDSSIRALRQRLFEPKKNRSASDPAGAPVRVVANNGDKKLPALREALGGLRNRIHKTKIRLRAKAMQRLVSLDTGLSRDDESWTIVDHRDISPSSYQAVESIINDYASARRSSTAPINIDVKLPSDQSQWSQESLRSPDRPSWADDATAAILRTSIDEPQLFPDDKLEQILVQDPPTPDSSNYKLTAVDNKVLLIQEPKHPKIAAATAQAQRNVSSSEDSMAHDKPFGDTDLQKLLSQKELDRVFSSSSESDALWAAKKAMLSSHRSAKQKLHDFFSGIRHASWSEARGRRYLKRPPLPTSMIGV